MCGVWTKSSEDRPQELSVDEYRDLFRQVKHLGVSMVTLAGGEPLARLDFFDIVAAAKAHNLRCHVFTNGTMIDDSTIEKILTHRIDKVIFSIDGIGAIHDSVRGMPGAYNKTIGALSDLVAAQKSNGARKPVIDVHLTLLKENIGSLSGLSDLCQKMGVNFSFQPYSESYEFAVEQSCLGDVSIGSERYLPHHESLRFSSEDISKIRDEIARIPKSIYTTLISSFSDDNFKHGSMPIKKCYITRNFMMLDPYGNVFPCTNLDSYILGCVRHEKLAEIWKGKKYEKLRKKLSKNLFPVCAFCCHCADNFTVVQLAKVILRMV